MYVTATGTIVICYVTIYYRDIQWRWRRNSRPRNGDYSTTERSLQYRRSGQKRKTLARFIAYHRLMCYSILLSRRSAACARAHSTCERDGDGANRRRARARQKQCKKLERARTPPPASERFAVVHVFSTQVGGHVFLAFTVHINYCRGSQRTWGVCPRHAYKSYNAIYGHRGG